MSAVLVGLHLEKFAHKSGKSHLVLICNIWEEAAKLTVASPYPVRSLLNCDNSGLLVVTTFSARSHSRKIISDIP